MAQMPKPRLVSLTDRVPRVCEFCRAPFYSSSDLRRYCSKRCKGKAAVEVAKKKGTTP